MTGFLEQLDEGRRLQGRLLDLMGFMPAETESRTVFSHSLFTLRRYGNTAAAGPAVLVVPAPIKRAYIWDLAPWASAVQEFLKGGIRVYLIQWERPGEQDTDVGLDDYADRFILACLDAVEAELGGDRAFLAGHSLGGTFASIFAALYPDRPQGLMLIGSPVKFGTDVGDLDRFIALLPRAQGFIPLTGNMPGLLVSLVSTLASPSTFQTERWEDWALSLADFSALRTHAMVVRWTLDEMPLAGRLFEDITELLYREDRFMRGTLRIGGRPVRPSSIRAPLLSVEDPRSRVVPPQAVLPFHAAVSSPDREVLWYKGDVGVVLQHVGMLVGRNAHRELWPGIIRWVHVHAV